MNASKRSLVAGLVLSLATLFAAPAMAGTGAPHTGGDGPRAEHGSFPMPAATFKAKVDARQAKAREHMEKRAASLPADQAKELRAKFDAGVTKINAEVSKATADGTVTKEEAEAVRKVVKDVRGGHGKHARHGKKHHKKS